MARRDRPAGGAEGIGAGRRPGRARAAIGFTIKSGWAAVVLLAATATSPRVVDRRRIELGDPSDPRARQPHHDGFASARRPGLGLTRLLASVRRFGRRSVAGLIREYRATGFALRGAGLVVGSLIDPDRIGNTHIRIHALEGRLFRELVAGAARRSRLACWVWRERDLSRAAAAALGRPERALRAALARLERPHGPWRAEHKAAALAAWMVLAGRGRGPTRSHDRVVAGPEAGRRSSPDRDHSRGASS